MNTGLRDELMNAIAELRLRYPEWRLGQLVSNIASWADQDVWDVEDEQLLAAAQAHLQQLAPLEGASFSGPLAPVRGGEG